MIILNSSIKKRQINIHEKERKKIKKTFDNDNFAEFQKKK